MVDFRLKNIVTWRYPELLKKTCDVAKNVIQTGTKLRRTGDHRHTGHGRDKPVFERGHATPVLTQRNAKVTHERLPSVQQRER